MKKSESGQVLFLAQVIKKDGTIKNHKIPFMPLKLSEIIKYSFFTLERDSDLIKARIKGA